MSWLMGCSQRRRVWILALPSAYKFADDCLVYRPIRSLERGRGAIVKALSFANVTACRAVSNPLGAGFSEKYHVSPLSILRHYFDVVALGNALYPYMLHLTQV